MRIRRRKFHGLAGHRHARAGIADMGASTLLMVWWTAAGWSDSGGRGAERAIWKATGLLRGFLAATAWNAHVHEELQVLLQRCCIDHDHRK
jgi:hypothetical protein